MSKIQDGSKGAGEIHKSSAICGNDPSSGLEVHVLGEVVNSGTFWVTPGTRVDEALTCAGGISSAGTVRNISLRRANTKQVVDIFSYRTFGDLNQNPYLSNQDVIFVPVYSEKVKIIGSVKKPGTYELATSRATVQEIIALAGGLSITVDPANPVTVLRPLISQAVTGDDALSYDELSLPSTQSVYELRNGDIVIVHDIRTRGIHLDVTTLSLPDEEGRTGNNLPTSFDRVFVTGDVNLPGPYSYKAYYTLNDYANEAGLTKTGNRKRIKLFDNTGVARQKDEKVSPGDMVYVPSRRLTLENTLALWNVTTSTFFSGFSVYTIFKNE